MFSSTVSPNDPIEDQPTIGIIGMGAMGKMYAKLFAKAGWKKYTSQLCRILRWLIMKTPTESM